MNLGLGARESVVGISEMVVGTETAGKAGKAYFDMLPVICGQMEAHRSPVFPIDARGDADVPAGVGIGGVGRVEVGRTAGEIDIVAERVENFEYEARLLGVGMVGVVEYTGVFQHKNVRHIGIHHHVILHRLT